MRSSTGEGGSEPGGGRGGGEGAGAAASWLSSAVGEKVDELLRREENRALLEGVEDAERRVERARAALADIERQEAAARLAREEVRRLENWLRREIWRGAVPLRADEPRQRPRHGPLRVRELRREIWRGAVPLRADEFFSLRSALFPLPFSLLFFSLLPCFSLPSIRAEAIALPSALPSPSPLAASLSWETAAGLRGRRRCSPVCTPPCFSLSLRFVLSPSLSLSLADGRNRGARCPWPRTSSGSVET